MHRYVTKLFSADQKLAYLLKHPRGYIHAIYGGTQALLYPIDKLITSIDFIEGTFTFVDKPRILQDLQMSEEQFLDVSLLAGCQLSRTFPPLVSDFSWRGVIELIRTHKSGIGVCQAWRDPKSQSYGETFMRARLAVKYSLVLTTEGVCLPLPLVVQPQVVTAGDVPTDLDDIFSMRLPDELYYLICRAWVSPQVVGWLSCGMIVENQPLADSPDYRKFIKDIITDGPNSPRCITLALLADALHPSWRQRRVVSPASCRR